MNTISLLILFPLAMAIIILLVRDEKLRNGIVRVGSLITIALTIYVACQYFTEGGKLSYSHNEEIINYGMLVVEVILALYIIIIGIKNKKHLVSLFTIIQTALIIGFEFTQMSGIKEVANSIVIDKLTVIMLLIVGTVGGLICLYSAGYMKWYHIHHAEYKQRKSFFFAVLFIFLAAMFGVVLSNHIMWLYFCWEITTFCSFLLIGYTKTKEATNNAFRALTFNLLGGVALAVGVVLLGMNYQTVELSTLIQLNPGLDVMVIVFLLAFAAMTKSAQFPFSSWLLGAMVAPTPTSALLHSATMVKAGVYLIIRLAPLLMGTSVGMIITIIGAITFLAASIMAITQSDAKKILAYSTISNLGLIVTCASIGTQEALWAAIMLMIFHAVCKSLLFLTVGAAEHQLGNRDVENMDVLASISKKLSLFMIIGIAGMFLAPFGMLISKWAAIKAFVDAGNMVTIIIVVFGSATTLFYWSKWMGKLLAGVNVKEHKEHKLHADESFSMWMHVIFAVLACMLFPLISKFAIIPFLGNGAKMSVGLTEVYIMIFMLVIILLFPLTYYLSSKKNTSRMTTVYMAGINAGDNESFVGATMAHRKVELRNWYMEDIFKLKPMTLWTNILTIVTIFVGIMLLVGGVL